MAKAPESTIVIVKHNKYARHDACCFCGADVRLLVGPCLFAEGCWEPVCDECAASVAPGMLAVIRAPELQRIYWAAEGGAGRGGHTG